VLRAALTRRPAARGGAAAPAPQVGSRAAAGSGAPLCGPAPLLVSLSPSAASAPRPAAPEAEPPARTGRGRKKISSKTCQARARRRRARRGSAVGASAQHAAPPASFPCCPCVRVTVASLTIVPFRAHRPPPRRTPAAPLTRRPLPWHPRGTRRRCHTAAKFWTPAS
jgi:hypothetical protein